MPRKKRETARFVQVLEYFDGPQAVLLEKSADSRIVGVAIDKEGYNNPFFGTNVSYEQWERYRRGYVDFRSLFVFPRWREWYFFDLIGMTPEGVIELIKTAKDSEAEENYVPASGFFSYDHSEKIISEVSASLATQKYMTDGIWALPDFTQFYNKLNDLYCFFISLKTYSSEFTSVDRKRQIKEAFSGHPLRGGSSYNNLYSDLAASQSFDDKIAIGRLKYASQGEVDVRGRFDVFGEIAVAYSELAENYDNVKEKYNCIYKFLANNRLLKAEFGRFDADGALSNRLLGLSNDFAASLHIADVQLIYDLTDKNSLIFSKVLLSYFRRLERYFMFFGEGRVKNPELRRSVQEK